MRVNKIQHFDDFFVDKKVIFCPCLSAHACRMQRVKSISLHARTYCFRQIREKELFTNHGCTPGGVTSTIFGYHVTLLSPMNPDDP